MCEVSIFNTVTFQRYPATVPYLIFYSIWYLIPASSDPQIGAYCLQQLPFHTHCPLFYRAIHIHTLNLPNDCELPAVLLSIFSSVSNSRNAEEDSNVIQYNDILFVAGLVFHTLINYGVHVACSP